MKWQQIKSRIGCLLSCILLTLGLVSCKQPPPLRVALSPWLGFEPIFIAQDLALRGSEQYQLFELSTPTHVSHVLRSGQADAAFMSLSQAILLANQGLDIHVVAITDRHYQSEALLFRPHALRQRKRGGMRIGYESQSASTLVLDDWFKLQGVDAKDFVLVEAKLDEHIDFFRDEKVDAIVTKGLHRQRLLDDFKAVNQDIPAERAIYHVLVVRAKFLDAPQLGVLIDNFEAGMQWMSAHPREARKFIAHRNLAYVKQVNTALEDIALLSKAQSLVLIKYKLQRFSHELATRLKALRLSARATLPENFMDSRWLKERAYESH